MTIESTQAIIRRRFSCRTYAKQPIPAEKLAAIKSFLETLPAGPFGSPARLQLVAATAEDADALKSLGTYGFIQSPTGFIAGIASKNEKNLEDFGYHLEEAVLFCTQLNLGSCWLGGTFSRSSFARKINASERDILPAVISIGEMLDPEQARRGLIRLQVNADQRLPWPRIFFDGDFNHPLERKDADRWTEALEMVRLGPSASNKQPWRILKKDGRWHFYLERTKGYRGDRVKTLLRIVDIQRLDMGIAMCHFEMSARELNLSGSWKIEEPEISLPNELFEYTVTWQH